MVSSETVKVVDPKNEALFFHRSFRVSFGPNGQLLVPFNMASSRDLKKAEKPVFQLQLFQMQKLEKWNLKEILTDYQKQVLALFFNHSNNRPSKDRPLSPTLQLPVWSLTKLDDLVDEIIALTKNFLEKCPKDSRPYSLLWDQLRSWELFRVLWGRLPHQKPSIAEDDSLFAEQLDENDAGQMYESLMTYKERITRKVELSKWLQISVAPLINPEKKDWFEAILTLLSGRQVTRAVQYVCLLFFSFFSFY